MHLVAARITSVCSASTNTRLLLCCTRALTCHYRSYCYDNPKYECESEKKKKRKEKKNTALTVNFQPLPVITASLFGCTKAHVPQAAFSRSVFFFFSLVKLTENCSGSFSTKDSDEPQTRSKLTFFDDCLICHNNTVVIYMLMKKRETEQKQQ